jgi:hypothetical protein
MPSELAVKATILAVGKAERGGGPNDGAEYVALCVAFWEGDVSITRVLCIDPKNLDLFLPQIQEQIELLSKDEGEELDFFID